MASQINMIPKPRRLYLEIEVDQHSTQDWHWIYDTMKSDEAKNGFKIFGIGEGWPASDKSDIICELCQEVGCDDDCPNNGGR